MVNHCQAEIRGPQSHQNLHAGVVNITDQEMIGIITELLVNVATHMTNPSFHIVQAVKTDVLEKTADIHMKMENVSGQPKMCEESIRDKVIVNPQKYVLTLKPNQQPDFQRNTKPVN